LSLSGPLTGVMPAAKVTSYYDALGVKRGCAPDDLKKAYRKLSLKFHPDRSSLPKPEAEIAFSEISEAYDVLSNPARRAIYDQYGERGLKDGIPDGQGGFKGGKYAFKNNAQEIFEKFFGTSSPFADILGATGEAPPSFYGELTGMQLPFEKKKAAPVVAPLEVTLAEVYNGAMKAVGYTRKVLKEDGTTADEAVEAQLYVKPGAEPGLLETLEGQGDQGVHVLPGDVEIELVVLDDPLWSREGNNLLYKHSMSLQEALCGKVVEVPTFDGRELAVPVTQIVAPGDSLTVPSEGICGADLIICFEIVFPTTLTPEQKKVLKGTLP